MMQPRSHKIARTTYDLVANHQNEEKALKKSNDEGKIESNDKDKQKAYGALVHKLPAMILQNGLAHATGFLLAKGRDEHIAVLKDLKDAFNKTSHYNFAEPEDFHAQLINADLQKTMYMTRHALEIAGWMRRYVQGILKIGATGDSEEPEQKDHQETPT
ncbi:MAG: type III-B CRISPR module-associated protein Cmr5 [Reinekea sp.]